MNSAAPREQVAKSFFDFVISDRDRALIAMHERDFEAQLIAVRELIHRNQEADGMVAVEVADLERHINSNRERDDQYEMHLENQWIDAMQASAFRGAAHSMAAVGMLAPLAESLFVAIFDEMRQRTVRSGVPQVGTSKKHQLPWQHVVALWKLIARRGSRPTLSGPISVSDNDFWDPHYIFPNDRRQKDLVKGIRRLSLHTGLDRYLPADLDKTLEALFGYRNRMFHCGFEWPSKERQAFERRVRENKWPVNWFEKAERNNEPWIFYMSSTLVDHCLTTIEQVLEGVGRYLNDARGQKG